MSRALATASSRTQPVLPVGLDAARLPAHVAVSMD